MTPPEVVLDTSFVVQALLPRQDNHADARQYMVKLADNGATVYFNRLLELELMDALLWLALKERWGKDEARYRRHDGRAKKRAKRLMTEGADAWEVLLSAFSWAVVEVEEVMPLVRDLMGDCGLRSYDAVHVATAMTLDVHAVVTSDAGFAGVGEEVYDLYVPDDRVDICRKFRSKLR